MEQLLEKFQNDLCLEEVYSTPSKCEDINKQIVSTEKDLQVLYEAWEDSLSETE